MPQIRCLEENSFYARGCYNMKKIKVVAMSRDVRDVAAVYTLTSSPRVMSLSLSAVLS